MITAIRRVGLRNYVHFRAHRLRDKLRPRDGLITLASNEARYPLVARGNTSDLSAFSGVFVRRTYAASPDRAAPGLIIDCGANVGYSAAFLLSRFPGSRLIAVEPETSNFAQLEQNLAPYGAAATLIHSAVWSHPTPLVIDKSPYRDGKHWSSHVREARRGELATMVAIDIGTLLAQSGESRLALLKMDIEGAEAVVFRHNFERWIDRVDAIAIELHDDSAFGDATAAFSQAIAGRGFALTRHGEIVLCRRADGDQPAAAVSRQHAASLPVGRRQQRKSA
jgi:FkbM family methyltransferase